MPSPFIIPAITAGSELINAGLTGTTNRKSRQWNEKMYAQQRQDALNDWNMQNEYNSPSAKMQRLRDAKLNPNLVYGQGTDATAGVPRGTSMDSWRPQTPQISSGELGNSLMSMYDIKIKEAQVDNLEAQNAVIRQDAVLRAYQAIKEGTDLRMGATSEPANMFESLKQTQLSVAQQLLEKSRTETSIMLSRNEREALSNAQSLREGIERIATMRLGRELTTAQKKSIENDTELKRYEIDLRRKYNVSASDPIYIRLITLFLDKLGIGQ